MTTKPIPSTITLHASPLQSGQYLWVPGNGGIFRFLRIEILGPPPRRRRAAEMTGEDRLGEEIWAGGAAKAGGGRD